jgi:biotin operon repressor
VIFQRELIKQRGLCLLLRSHHRQIPRILGRIESAITPSIKEEFFNKIRQIFSIKSILKLIFALSKRAVVNRVCAELLPRPIYSPPTAPAGLCRYLRLSSGKDYWRLCMRMTRTSRTSSPTLKQDQLIALLKRKSPPTIEALGKRLDWQPHTVRAAISRLRTAGYSVETVKATTTTAMRYRLEHAVPLNEALTTKASK